MFFSAPSFTNMASIKYVLFVLGSILLTVSSSFAQPQVIDSLKKQFLLNKANDTLRVAILDELSQQYQWLDFDSSLYFASQSLKMAEQLQFKKGIAIANYRMGNSYWSLGISDISIKMALISIDIGKEEKYKSITAEGYRLLAMNYRDQQQLDKAESYIKLAEGLAIEDKNWELLARIYNFSGVIQFSKINYDSAQQLYYKAFQITKEYSTPEYYLANILSNLSDTYFVKGQNQQGLKYLYEALSIAQSTRNKSAEAGILFDLGKNFTEIGQFKKAENYLVSSLSLARQIKLKRVIKNVYAGLVDLKMKENKSSEAIKYLTSYYEIRDSLLKTKEIAELEARTEVERKEIAIKLLEQEKKIQQMWNGFLIIGSLLLVLASMIIYSLQKSRNIKAKLLLETQRQLNLKLKETDELKSKFFANISHEFRTPLSLIIAPLERQLLSGDINEHDKGDLKLAKRNANRLLDLINQLLDLSKLEVGKMQLNNKHENLQEFVSILAASFDSFAETKKIMFKKAINIPEQQFIFDKDKIEKIISNILFNAFKFTPTDGSVTLSISVVNNALLIKLIDTGKGVPKEELPHIFSLFYQSKNITDDGYPGTGLGLAMVNELVKLHNGTIEFSSELNVGTTVQISLPLSITEKSDQSISSFNSVPFVLTDLKNEFFMNDEDQKQEIFSDSLLIVEDNEELRNFIASAFNKTFHVIMAADGNAGLAMALEHIPSLVISDVMMPEMDGLTLVEKLKSDERTSHIPTILLTAKSDDKSRMEGLIKGADEYLTKPFSLEELKIRVKNLNELRKKLIKRHREHIVSKIHQYHEPSLDEKFLLNLRSAIEKNMSDTSFSVEQLSEEMCLSRTQLFRKVKGLLEVSPNELINEIRLQRAAEMIRAKSDTLTQISYAVGFNEQSYFAKRFRKKFGLSPSEYANAKHQTSTE